MHLLLPLIGATTAVAAHLPRYAESIPTIWSNTTAQLGFIPDLAGRALEPRQCAGMLICAGRSCMPRGNTCCSNGRYCPGNSECYFGGCCPSGWRGCRATDGSGRERCFPASSGALCCSNGGYCPKGTYCWGDGRCCENGKLCRAAGTGGFGDGLGWNSGGDAADGSNERTTESTTQRAPATTARETPEAPEAPEWEDLPQPTSNPLTPTSTRTLSYVASISAAPSSAGPISQVGVLSGSTPARTGALDNASPTPESPTNAQPVPASPLSASGFALAPSCLGVLGAVGVCLAWAT